MSYVPVEIRNQLSKLKYLPKEIRDFHDQKDLFKAIDRTFNQPEFHNVDWVDAHIYTIDTFLWVMAAHGYTLQKTRSKTPKLDLRAFMDGEREASAAAFSALIEGNTSNE